MPYRIRFPEAFAVVLAAATLCIGAAAAEPAKDKVAAAVPADLALRDRGDGTVMSDRKGMTVYTYQQDVEPGKSACVDQCAKAWPPVLATGEAPPAEGWSVITRDDGTKQWAYKNKPLYTFAKDLQAGDEKGADVKGWHLIFQPITIPPGMRLRSAAGQEVLVTAKGMTLYTSAGDAKAGKPGCTGHCADTWAPMVAPAIAVSRDIWSVVTRDDGTKQWAFKGKPIYSYIGDGKPGEMNGEGVDKVWTVAVVRPAPPHPDWVTIQQSLLGEIFADPKGMTLYGNFRASDRQKFTCDTDCLAANWRPVVAAADAKPVGLWTVVTNTDGSRQWAYKDKPLYTYTKDIVVGDVRGHTYGFSGGDYPGHTWKLSPLANRWRIDHER